MPRRTTSSLAISALLVLALGACDDPPKQPDKTAGAASASASATQAAPVTPSKPKGMPDLLVDAEGPYLDGQRVDMTQKEALDKLTKIIKGLPINGQPVTLIADKKAKTPYVAI